MNQILSYASQRDALPEIARVDASRPLHWLGQGWRDLTQNPAASLAYGCLMAASGWVILLFASGNPSFFAAAVSGFLLVAPLLASGLYEMSRRRSSGEQVTFDDSLEGLKPNLAALARMGLVIAVVAIAWERFSSLLFGAFFGGSVYDITEIRYRIFLSWEDPGFLIAYIGVGAVLALFVFAISAVSVPMLMDRRVDVTTAMFTSVKAVGANWPAMAFWAGLIVTLTAIGFTTFLLGLIVVVPWLGHATWHAYKDLVRCT